MGIAFFGMIEPFNKMVPSHTFMKKLRNGAPTIFLRSFREIIPDLNPFAYCLWNEPNKTIKWNRVTSIESPIVALKRAVKEMLCLKVARLGPIDYIGCHRTRKII